MRTFVKKNEYDFYSISVPLKVLVTRRTRIFILNELEKRHPCYSSKFFTDIKVKFRNKKLCAEVVVMEMAKFLDYRKSSDGKIRFEGLENRTVGGKLSSISKWILLILISVMSVFASKFYGPYFRKFIIPETAQEIVPEENNLGESEAMKNNELIISPSELLQSVLFSVSSNGGKLQTFDFESSTFRLNVYGCSNEKIVGARYCTVVYKDGVPQFNLVLPSDGNIFGFRKFSSKPVKIRDDCEFLEKFRNELFSLNCRILTEKISEEKIEISFSCASSVLYSVLKNCVLCEEEFSLYENLIKISVSGEESQVKLSFGADEHECGRILTVLCQYSFLFQSKTPLTSGNKIYRTEKVKTTEETVPGLKQIPLAELVHRNDKIGEIRKRDGSLFIYYRNKDGKFNFESRSSNEAVGN